MRPNPTQTASGGRAADDNVALCDELLALYVGLRTWHRAAAVAVASKPWTGPVGARLANDGLGERRHRQPLQKGAARGVAPGAEVSFARRCIFSKFSKYANIYNAKLTSQFRIIYANIVHLGNIQGGAQMTSPPGLATAEGVGAATAPRQVGFIFD
jgi:hypothetical protein